MHGSPTGPERELIQQACKRLLARNARREMRRWFVAGVAAAVTVAGADAAAQPAEPAHQHGTPPAEPAHHHDAPAADPERDAPPADPEHEAPAMAPEQPREQRATTPLGIPETREASGTSWQPESTPMFMWHWTTGGWSVGLHTNVFAGYDNKTSDRGDDKLVSINWLMAMARHPLGDGDLTLRAMLSLEPFTVGKSGYPLLLQTGEALDGMPLHDRQHPHDLFMEVAARYRQPIGDTVGLELYVAPAGEPAIGPPAFPHRFTAMADPLAPLGHHWHDSTHISFGVLTAGLFTRTVKLEGSWFNGREPDDQRYDFDLRTPDSFAARLTLAPTADTSAQVSWARLDSPEALEPDVSVQRATASILWNRASGDRDLAVTALYGRNDPSMGPPTNAGLGEAAVMLRREHTVFTRAELLEKTGRDLALPADLTDRTFGMASFSAGYVYDATRFGDIVPGIGFVATVDAIGSDLASFYGTRTPWGGMVFVRLRPPEMKHGAMSGHAMPGM